LVSNSAKTLQHIEETLTCGRAGIDRLLGGLEGNTFGLERADNVLKVADGSRQAIDARHHERVAFAQEFQQRLELLASLHAGRRAFLPADGRAARGLERSKLDGKVLIGGADAGVAESRAHYFVLLGSRP
jgi:hypothetical protein